MEGCHAAPSTTADGQCSTRHPACLLVVTVQTVQHVTGRVAGQNQYMPEQREVQPGLQEGYERGLPKCCLKTFLFNVSIEAAEDGTLTFVHPEPPGAWADRLPTTAPILPKAKVGLRPRLLAVGWAVAGVPHLSLCQMPTCVTLLVLWVERRTHKGDPGQAEAGASAPRSAAWHRAGVLGGSMPPLWAGPPASPAQRFSGSVGWRPVHRAELLFRISSCLLPGLPLTHALSVGTDCVTSPPC